MRVGEIGIPMLVVILKYRILYDLDRPLGKIRQVIKNINFFLLREVQGNFQTARALFRVTTKTKILIFICFESLVIFLLMVVITMSWISTIHTDLSNIWLFH